MGMEPGAGAGLELELKPGAGDGFQLELELVPGAGAGLELELKPGAGDGFQLELELLPEAGTGCQESQDSLLELESGAGIWLELGSMAVAFMHMAFAFLLTCASCAAFRQSIWYLKACATSLGKAMVGALTGAGVNPSSHGSSSGVGAGFLLGGAWSWNTGPGGIGHGFSRLLDGQAGVVVVGAAYGAGAGAGFVSGAGAGVGGLASGGWCSGWSWGCCAMRGNLKLSSERNYTKAMPLSKE